MHALAALEDLESRTLLTSLTAGMTYATAVSSLRPVKNWTIHLTAGQAIYVAAGTSGDTSFAPRLSLITPDHVTLARSADGRGAMIAETAPVTGIYTVRVRDNGGSTTAGDLRVTAVFTGRTPVADGDDGRTPISGDSYTASIEPGDLDVWRIDATAREYVEGVIVSTGARRPISVAYALIKPNGAETDRFANDVGDGPYGAGAPLSFELSGREAVQAGTYYAIVYEPSGNASGRYAFGIAAASGKQSKNDVNTKQPLSTPNSTRSGDLSVANFDVFRVTPPKGQGVTIDAVNTNRHMSGSAPTVQLIDATGKDVTNDILNGGSGEDTDSVYIATLQAGAVAPFYAIVGDAGSHAYTLHCSFG